MATLLFALGIIGTGMLAVPVLAGDTPETLAAHLAWAKESFESGALRMSGPADEGRGGAYIIEAETVEAARSRFMPVRVCRAEAGAL